MYPKTLNFDQKILLQLYQIQDDVKRALFETLGFLIEKKIADTMVLYLEKFVMNENASTKQI